MTRLSVFALTSALLAGCQTQQGTNTAVGTGAATGAALAPFSATARAQRSARVRRRRAVSSAKTGRPSATKSRGDSKGTGTQVTEQQDGSLKVNIPNSISFDTNSYAIK